jgi:uncharacterized membrane protein YkvA (DUF1232 family)
MAFAQFAFSQDEQKELLGRFWSKLRRVCASIPFAEDLLTAYYCAFDRNTPLTVKASLVAAIAYFVLPFDAIPDMLPILGFTDDAALLAATIKLVTAYITPEHRTAARNKLAELSSST